MSGPFRSFAVIPAAGESRRMGRPKLLLPWEGSTVIETVLAAWQASSVERIVVVVRPGDEVLAELVRRQSFVVPPLGGPNRLKAELQTRIDLVIADAPPPDMKASVLLGLAHLEHHYHPAASDAWLLAPADLPRLPPAVIDEVLNVYQSRRMDNRVRPNGRDCPSYKSIILAPTIGGKRGHPVLFPWSCVAAARQLGDDQGLNSLLQPGVWHPIPCDHLASINVWQDLDLPGDYEPVLPHK